mmetsp:Transcript_16913/g.28802  ORF Transcript_16913/g.28802 Transcript_16913/m.28802 type:complete len:230 (+) Transcript_16913:120-809(+)
MADALGQSAPLGWDPSHCGENIALDGAEASHETSQWGSVLATEWLSEGTHEIELLTQNVDYPSLFVGVVRRAYWEHASAGARREDGESMRDSEHAICMHGDGRLFIKTAEKDWGLMRLVTGDRVVLTLDFDRGVVTFALSRTVRGKPKETVAEVPGLFTEATVAVCFGGRDQCVAIGQWTRRASEGGAAPARDPFAEATSEPVARLTLDERDAERSNQDEMARVASTLQ